MRWGMDKLLSEHGLKEMENLLDIPNVIGEDMRGFDWVPSSPNADACWDDYDELMAHWAATMHGLSLAEAIGLIPSCLLQEV